MIITILSLLLFSGTALVNAGCSATISSLDDVAYAAECTQITLKGFTVPAGQALNLDLATGTTVMMDGDISFGNLSWAGPLVTVSGDSITFNGNGHKINGGGPHYWDGYGLSGGIQKPDPMVKIRMSGTFTNVSAVNVPARAFSVTNDGPLIMSNIIVDNSQGDAPNAQSYGLPAAHNTDAFDVSANDVTIEDCKVHNQDDCLALNKGTNILFQYNQCSGGHGISIGSISSDITVSGVVIKGNTITNSDQALRIKTKSSAKGSTVSDITYSDNHAIGIRKFGVLIDQSYPETLGKAGSGVIISDVNFVAPASVLSVNPGAKKVAVNCGHDSCQGDWNWSQLKVSSGVAGPINYSGISGFSQ